MKAFLILEDGTVFSGTSIGAEREVISEIVFNTSMTGYLEVLTDPSYAGQAVTMTYPLIGNYGICYKDMESLKAWPDGFIVRELSRMPSNFRCEDTIQKFLVDNNIPGIAGIDTRALAKIQQMKIIILKRFFLRLKNIQFQALSKRLHVKRRVYLMVMDLKLLFWILVQRKILLVH